MSTFILLSVLGAWILISSFGMLVMCIKTYRSVQKQLKMDRPAAPPLPFRQPEKRVHPVKVLVIEKKVGEYSYSLSDRRN